MQLQIDPNIPSNVPDEELRDFQSFIQTALDGLTDAAGGEVFWPLERACSPALR